MRKRTKILFIDTGIKIGGGQRSLLLLLNGINKVRFEPILACPEGSLLVQEAGKISVQTRTFLLKRPAPTTKGNSDKYTIVSAFLIMTSIIPAIINLIQVIREEKISLIHANTFEASIIAGVASKIVKIPIIYHKRFVFSHGFVDRISDMLCDKIILVSKAAMWPFVHYGGNFSKYIVIYNGVSLQEYNLDINPQDMKTEFCIAEGTKVVGTVCRISPEKGLDFFLQAAKKVVNIFPDSKFIIVGGAFFETDRVYQSELKKLASNIGLSNHVIFTGFRNDVARVMAGMDIVVLPSVIDDAFPRTPLEAMALAKPVVATKVGGIPEAVVDKVTGLLIPPRDSDSLANAIITLLDNPDIASTIGMAGRNRVEQLFDSDKNQQEIEQLFMEVIAHRIV